MIYINPAIYGISGSLTHFSFLLDQNLKKTIVADCATTEINGKFSETVSTQLFWRHLTEERGFLTDTTVYIL